MVSLGIGTKYMSSSAMQASAEKDSKHSTSERLYPRFPKRAVRDCHAEVLARRAFRLYLARELLLGDASTILELHEPACNDAFTDNGEIRTCDNLAEDIEIACWRLKESVGIHLYTSSMPCGNACVRKWANGCKEVTARELGPMQLPKVAHPPFHAHARKDGQISPMWKRDSEHDGDTESSLAREEWHPTGVTFVQSQFSGEEVQIILIDPVQLGRGDQPVLSVSVEYPDAVS